MQYGMKGKKGKALLAWRFMRDQMVKKVAEWERYRRAVRVKREDGGNGGGRREGNGGDGKFA